METHSSKFTANSGPEPRKSVVFAKTVLISLSVSLKMLTPCDGKRKTWLPTALVLPEPGMLVSNCGYLRRTWTPARGSGVVRLTTTSREPVAVPQLDAVDSQAQL